ncbi:MAG: BON domain-containing protein [Pedosphaera parvula]|nr:BON domain-containing protein [Pedosphaera parvula]
MLMHKYLTEYTPRTAGSASGYAPQSPTAPLPGAPETAEDSLTRILREWRLTPEDIRRQLDRAGQVIKREGGALTERLDGATLDARIVTVIEAKYTLDRDLSAWDISVASTQGHVTLSGTVNEPDLVVRAVVMALDTAGVVDVKSALRVKTSAVPPLPPVEP